MWDEGQNAKASSVTIAASLKAGLIETGGQYAGRVEGDALKAIAGAAKKVEATCKHTIPLACLHGADGLHYALHVRARGGLGAHAIP